MNAARRTAPAEPDPASLGRLLAPAKALWPTIVALILAVCLIPSSSASEPEYRAAVRFLSPLERQDALAWAAERGARITEAGREWVFGPDDTITAGLVMDPEQDEPGGDELTMAELMEALAADLAADPNVSENDRRRAAGAATQARHGDDRVTTLKVLATREEIDAMRSDPAVAGVTSTDG